MPRKRKVREEEFQVTTVDDNTDNGETTTTVQSPDANTAINKAGQGNPNIRQSEKVTVTKGNPGGPQTTPQTTSQKQGQPSGTQGMQGLTGQFESTRFNYDYTIGLPGGFADFMKKTKGRTKGIMVEQRNGRVYMTVETADAMTKLMGKLKKSSRSRTVETRDKANTMIRGIVGSMKR